MIGNSMRIPVMIGGPAVLMILLAIAGCDSGGGRMFPEANLVGSGLEIDWISPEKGVAFLVEEKRNRILKTQSIEQGEKFAFSVAGIDSEQQFEALFGVKFSEANFSLYFLPEGREFKK